MKGSAAEWFYLLSGRPQRRMCVTSQAGNNLAALPSNVAEARTRIEANLRRMEHAIANHQFPAARHFSQIDRQERAALERLLVDAGS